MGDCRIFYNITNCHTCTKFRANDFIWFYAIAIPLTHLQKIPCKPFHTIYLLSHAHPTLSFSDTDVYYKPGVNLAVAMIDFLFWNWFWLRIRHLIILYNPIQYNYRPLHFDILEQIVIILITNQKQILTVAWISSSEIGFDT